jgi:hypothetical protein
MLVSEGKTLVAQNWRVIWKASFLSLVLTLWCGIYTDHNQKHDLQKSCLLRHFSLSPLDLLVVSNGWDRDSRWWFDNLTPTSSLFSSVYELVVTSSFWFTSTILFVWVSQVLTGVFFITMFFHFMFCWFDSVLICADLFLSILAIMTWLLGMAHSLLINRSI